jgi:hypothetical protein
MQSKVAEAVTLANAALAYSALSFRFELAAPALHVDYTERDDATGTLTVSSGTRYRACAWLRVCARQCVCVRVSACVRASVCVCA